MNEKQINVGIVSLFHDSTNYGGILQAYALTKVLNDSFNVKASQICYKRTTTGRSIKRIKKVFNIVKCYRFVKNRINKLLTKKVRQKILGAEAKRVKPFALFVDANINKTDEVYNQNTIKDTLDKFDVFITGSDQVWNVMCYDDVYRLDFVPKTKYKFSYAAGVSSGKLTEAQVEVFSNSLISFDAVSVREEFAVNTLQPLTDKTVEWLLDPTLLLSCDNWENICSEKQINEKYVFCYFLGGLPFKNKKIINFAKSRNLKIVSMPYLSWTSKANGDFGDYRIYDATPQDFISLIKNAEYVFTDSFHATVFSHIYKKNFFVFNRAGLKSMNDRIYSLTSLFDTQERFCDTKEKEALKYIESLPSIDYNRIFPKLENMKEKSIKFLKENLKKAEEKINGNKQI